MDFNSLARRALEMYPMEFKDIHYLAQSGNTVFKATDSFDNHYSLHINVSKNDALDSKWTSKTAILSQLQWVSALSSCTDLAVPAPYKNREGELVTDIDGILCTLLIWLEGEHKPYVQTKDDAGNIGEMIAKLHKQASEWAIPSGFERPYFDSFCIKSALDELGKVTAFNIKKETLDIYEAAGLKLISLLDSLEKNDKTWGLIHCDIIPPNFIFYNNEVRPIDFGACGFGFFLWDIAILFSFTPLTLRQAVFNSYSKIFHLPENYIGLTEAFFVGANIEVLNFYLRLKDAVEWLPDEMDKLADREFTHYINNESFLFKGKPFWE